MILHSSPQFKIVCLRLLHHDCFCVFLSLQTPRLSLIAFYKRLLCSRAFECCYMVFYDGKISFSSMAKSRLYRNVKKLYFDNFKCLSVHFKHIIFFFCQIINFYYYLFVMNKPHCLPSSNFNTPQ